MKKLFLVLLLLALAVGGWAVFDWRGPGPNPRDGSIQIPSGATLRSAARQLQEKGIIRDAERFRIFSRLFGGNVVIKAGEFAMPAGASARQVLEILRSGRPIQRFVTIPEGMPSIIVHERLMAEKLLTGAVAVPPEGSVLPDSYSFERGETRAALLTRMQAAMTRTLDQLWRARTPNSIVKDKREAVILASVVEKETGKPQERRLVAGVYTNRLRIGMPLQADPTVIYPVTRGKPLGRRILRSELQADNGYNTYARAGLPAGPIANPGRESIAAVLNPEQTRALYFVADGTGGHIFAETLAEHEANVRKWYAIRRERGEM